MTLKAIDPGAEVGAWVAALAGVFALGSQVWKVIKTRTKERQQIKVALDTTPEVKRQLELGNLGEALKHLKDIIESQSRHINAQAERLHDCDEEIDTQRERAERAEEESRRFQAENDVLRQQIRVNERRHEEEILAIRESNARDRRILARALAQARGELPPAEEGE